MKFVDNSKHFKRLMDKKSLQFLAESSELVEGSMKTLAPVDLGALRNQSIGYEIHKGTLRAEVGSNSSYAIYVHEGTGEYARNGMGRKGGWRYKDQEGKWHFTNGQKPQRFIHKAFRNNKANIQTLAKNLFKDIK